MTKNNNNFIAMVKYTKMWSRSESRCSLNFIYEYNDENGEIFKY